MTKVLFLTHVGDPGGAEFVMLRLCKAMEDTSAVLYFQRGSLENTLKEQGISSFFCEMPPGLRRFKRGSGLVSLIRAIPETILVIKKLVSQGRNFDVIVCMSQKSFIFSSLAKCILKKPIIWFMNDIVSKEHFSNVSISIIKILSRFSANYVVLNSQASMDAWLSMGGREDHVRMIFPGTDSDAFDVLLNDKAAIQAYKNKFSKTGKPIVGIVGRISAWKGQDIFLKAIARLKDVNGVIIGSPYFGEENYQMHLEDLVRALSIEDRVTFVGQIDDVPSAMAACDIIVHCSTAPEPFGLVIVEAMLAGTPVIATNAGGAREIIIPDKTGQLTRPGDIDELCLAIQKYLDNPNWALEQAKQAKIRAKENFSSKNMIDQFKSLIRECV